MATGTTPFWSAPGVDPRMVDVEASVQADALPREIARPLTEFLERALRRDARERFDTADDMLRAWRLLFDRLDAAHAGEAATVDADRLRAAATLTTSVTAIGLSARAVDAAERLEVLTVGDLFGVNLGDVERLRGVGLDTRRELVDARTALRRHLDPPAASTTADDETPDVQALDALVAQLVPKQTRKTSAQVDGLRRLRALGLERLHPGHGPIVEDPAAKLDGYIAHRLERERRIVGALEAGARSHDDLLAAAWDDVPAGLRLPATWTLEAHLEKLREEGRLPDGVGAGGA